MSEFKLSAFADEYAAATEEQLQGLASLGIGYIELRHLDGKNISKLSEDEVKQVKSRLSHYGIRASAIGSPLGKIKLDGDMEAHLEDARRVFQAANLLDTPLVRTFSFYPPDGQDITALREQVFEAVERLIDLAQEHGVVLCHENEAKIYGDTPARCYDLLSHFGGRLRCVFDMGNFVLEGVDPTAAYGLLQPYIAYFHVKDALAAGAVVPPGCGDAKIREIITAHKDYADADFFVSLEPHLQTFSGLNALVGRGFDNPYKYPDPKTAFTDAVEKFRGLV